MSGRCRLDDLKVAPFHLLAVGRQSPVRPRPRLAHGASQTACAADPKLLSATRGGVVDLADATAMPHEAIAWWEDMTSRGGEGMVVKPLDFVAAAAARDSSSRR